MGHFFMFSSFWNCLGLDLEEIFDDFGVVFNGILAKGSSNMEVQIMKTMNAKPL